MQGPTVSRVIFVLCTHEKAKEIGSYVPFAPWQKTFHAGVVFQFRTSAAHDSNSLSQVPWTLLDSAVNRSDSERR